MLYRKEGFPEEGELVLCTVTKVFPHSVFVTLDEFERKSGMINIAEVSPGRIRNIRDYVAEGKKIVCKVLALDKKKGHIDLSLRRVTDGQKRVKNDEIKQEQKSEKIIEFIAKSLNKDLKQFYNEITEIVFKKYDYLSECFERVVAGKANLADMGIEKKTAEVLTKEVLERIKPPEVEVKGKLKLKSYKTDGVEIVKEAIKKAEGKGKGNLTVKYVGGGSFKLGVKSDNYKSAEKILNGSVEAAINYIEKQDGDGKFVKE